MNRPLDHQTGPTNRVADAEPHEHGTTECARCTALEARIAELEAITGQQLEQSKLTGKHTGQALPLLEFKALRLVSQGWGAGWQLRPSPPRRHWMDEQPHAYKCLPLVMANQWGWQILSPTDVAATWNGDPTPAGLNIDVDPQFSPTIKSQFGAGIVTFSPPWLFRTPQGWDLYSKGPSNRWKPNCVPLEGVIETWWLNYTFTLNWKLVEPGTVYFSRGESLAQLLPVPHATFEDATALEAPIGVLEPQAVAELHKWQEERRRVTGEKVNVHHLYRKAEGVEHHLQRLSVPEVTPIAGWDR
jgi:Family of unknown function (DUF6065)